MVVQSSAESSKNIISEALKIFIAVDNLRALVTMGDLAKFRKVHESVPPNFNKGTYKHACVMEGDDVLALRVEEGLNSCSSIRRTSRKENGDRR